MEITTQYTGQEHGLRWLQPLNLEPTEVSSTVYSADPRPHPLTLPCGFEPGKQAPLTPGTNDRLDRTGFTQILKTPLPVGNRQHAANTVRHSAPRYGDPVRNSFPLGPYLRGTIGRHSSHHPPTRGSEKEKWVSCNGAIRPTAYDAGGGVARLSRASPVALGPRRRTVPELAAGEGSRQNTEPKGCTMLLGAKPPSITPPAPRACRACHHSRRVGKTHGGVRIPPHRAWPSHVRHAFHTRFAKTGRDWLRGRTGSEVPWIWSVESRGPVALRRSHGEPHNPRTFCGSCPCYFETGVLPERRRR